MNSWNLNWIDYREWLWGKKLPFVANPNSIVIVIEIIWLKDLNYRIGMRSYITKRIQREDSRDSWLHCSHQEQEGVFFCFFYIFQYRQSLLASVEHETISAKSVPLWFFVFLHGNSCLLSLDDCRPNTLLLSLYTSRVHVIVHYKVRALDTNLRHCRRL